MTVKLYKNHSCNKLALLQCHQSELESVNESIIHNKYNTMVYTPSPNAAAAAATATTTKDDIASKVQDEQLCPHCNICRLENYG